MRKIGTHPRFILPYAAVMVSEGENGERVVEGSKPFVDSLPNVSFTKVDHTTGNIVRLTHEQRTGLAAEYAAKREIKVRKRARVAAHNALPPEERAKVDAKKASATDKRKATKAAKEAAKPVRAPHTFVRVIRTIDRFIPPPALDKPMTPPPVSATIEAEAMAKLESEETKAARLARLEAYKSKPRPTWFGNAGK